MKTLWIILAFSVIAAHSQEVNCQIELDLRDPALINFKDCKPEISEDLMIYSLDYILENGLWNGILYYSDGFGDGIFGRFYGKPNFYHFNNLETYKSQNLREINFSDSEILEVISMNISSGVVIPGPFIYKTDEIFAVCWLDAGYIVSPFLALLSCMIRTDGINDFNLSIINPGITPVPITSSLKTSSNLVIPSHSGIHLQTVNSATIEIYELNGALFRKDRFDPGTHSVSLSHLPKGTYVVKVSFNTGSSQTFRIPVL